MGRGGGGPDPGPVRHVRVGELVADGGDCFVGAGVEVDAGAGVVGEALDAVGVRGWVFYDGVVAGVADGVGLVMGTARVAHGDIGRGGVDGGIDAGRICIDVRIVGDEVDGPW